MSFGDFFTELLNEQRNKAIKNAKEKAINKNINKISVRSEDYVLTDEEFDKFMKENAHLIDEME